MEKQNVSIPPYDPAVTQPLHSMLAEHVDPSSPHLFRQPLTIILTEEQMGQIAELAAQKAATLAVVQLTESFYSSVGKTVVRSFLKKWLIYIGVVAITWGTAKSGSPFNFIRELLK